ncbi:MAG: hypothetical protein ACP5O6_09100 [Candidatus Baltobacteraceae bacterium]
MTLAFIAAPFVGSLALFVLVLAILPIWFLWRALDRAGLAGPLALISLIPFGLFVVLGILAFAEWPNLRMRSEQQ